ncbi:hypothetical protein [Microbacterium binotii]
MTITTEPAAEPERPRLALFWGATLTTLVIGFAATLGGATVKPLLDVPALIAQVSGGEQPAPADPGAPLDPGAAPAPAPSTPTAAEPCTTGTSPFTLLVCDTAERLGWTVTATTAELTPSTAFTVQPAGVLATGETFWATRIQDGTSVIFTETGASDGASTSLTAMQEPLPAQSTASVADEIRGALGVSDIWFFQGDDLVDGPSMYFGSGWSIATKYDSARPVGTVVTAGARTLTVTDSAPEVGTVYRVN